MREREANAAKNPGAGNCHRRDKHARLKTEKKRKRKKRPHKGEPASKRASEHKTRKASKYVFLFEKKSHPIFRETHNIMLSSCSFSGRGRDHSLTAAVTRDISHSFCHPNCPRHAKTMAD